MSFTRTLTTTEFGLFFQESFSAHQKTIENAYATLLLQRPLMAGIFFSTTGVGIWLLTTPSIPFLTLASAGFGVYTVANEGLAWLETTHTELLKTILKPIYTRLEYESSLPPVVQYKDICRLLGNVWAHGLQIVTEVATLKQRYPTLYLPTVCAISFYIAVIGMQLATITLTYVFVYGVSLIPAIYHYRVIQNCENLIRKVIDEYVDEAALDGIISKIPLRSLDSSPNLQNRKERKRRQHLRSREDIVDDNGDMASRVPVSHSSLPSGPTSPPKIEVTTLQKVKEPKQQQQSIPTTIPVVQGVTETIAVDHNLQNTETNKLLSESVYDDEWEKDFDDVISDNNAEQ